MVHQLRALSPMPPTGALTFEAEKTGDHDDLVVALALACMVNPAHGRATSFPNLWV